MKSSFIGRWRMVEMEQWDQDLSAATALIAMRGRSRSALPELTSLMDSENSDVALRAMIATLGMAVLEKKL